MTSNTGQADDYIRAGEWLKEARRRLASQAENEVQRQESGLAAQVLLAHIIHRPRAWVIAHPEAELSQEQRTHLDMLLSQLAGGTPLPYLLGRQEFYGLDFEVTPDVLIPRPETELLVERALGWLKVHPNRRSAADVGTGSGIIAVSLAKNTPGLHVVAVDRSWQALQIALRNAHHHQVCSQVQFVLGSLLSAAAGPFDLVCANLPYIPSASVENLLVSKNEPLVALDGGEDGLAYIRELIQDAPRWLASGGLLLLEMQFDQGEAIRRLASASIPEAEVHIVEDLAGLPRVVEVRNNTN